MVKSDDFLQNCDVLNPKICKPGGCCLFGVEMRLQRLITRLSICISHSKVSKIRVVMIDCRKDKLLSMVVSRGKNLW